MQSSVLPTTTIITIPSILKVESSPPRLCKKISQEDMEGLRNALERMGIPRESVQDGKILYMYLNGGNEIQQVRYAMKIDGNWYILDPIRTPISFGFVSF